MSNDTFRDYLDNKLGSIDSHVSELIPDTAELRSMRINNPELYRDFIDRWLTTIDGHIVDIINGGGIHPGPTPPVPPVSDILISKYDFTKATDYLIDEINPLKSFTASSVLTHDSNGIYFPNTKNGVLTAPRMRFVWDNWTKIRLEIDVGACNMGLQDNHIRFIMTSNSTGLMYRGGSSYHYWAMYQWNWGTPASDTDLNTFDNSTISMEFDNSGTFYIYKNGTLFKNFPNFGVYNIDSANLLIGSSSNSIYDIYIKGLRLYAKNN